jgi:Protein of unknown function (DUF2934)
MPATATSQPGSVQRESRKADPRPKPDSSAVDIAANSTHEDIANLAYALWQRRGCPDGSAEEDWLEAEQQLGRHAEASKR